MRATGTVTAAARAKLASIAGAQRRAVAAVTAVAVVSGGGTWVATQGEPSGAVPAGAPDAIPVQAYVDTAAWSARGRVVLASVERQLGEIAAAEAVWNGLPAGERDATPTAVAAMLERRDVLVQHQLVLRSALATIESLDAVGTGLERAEAELIAIEQALAKTEDGDETSRRLLGDQRAARLQQRDAKLVESAALTNGVRSTMEAPIPDLEPSTHGLTTSVLGIVDNRGPEPEPTTGPDQVLAVTTRENEDRARQDVTIGGPLVPDPEDDGLGAVEKPAEREEPRGSNPTLADGLPHPDRDDGASLPAGGLLDGGGPALDQGAGPASDQGAGTRPEPEAPDSPPNVPEPSSQTAGDEGGAAEGGANPETKLDFKDMIGDVEDGIRDAKGDPGRSSAAAARDDQDRTGSDEDSDVTESSEDRNETTTVGAEFESEDDKDGSTSDERSNSGWESGGSDRGGSESESDDEESESESESESEDRGSESNSESEDGESASGGSESEDGDSESDDGESESDDGGSDDGGSDSEDGGSESDSGSEG